MRDITDKTSKKRVAERKECCEKEINSNSTRYSGTKLRSRNKGVDDGTHLIRRKELDRFRVWRVFGLDKDGSNLNSAVVVLAKRIPASIVLRRRLPYFRLVVGRQLLLLLLLRSIGKRGVTTHRQVTKSTTCFRRSCGCCVFPFPFVWQLLCRRRDCRGAFGRNTTAPTSND